MKTLYLECNMGAAGDMLMAALLELHPDPADFLGRLEGLGIPGVTISAETASKCGITGTHMQVAVDGVAEESHDVHSYAHSHDCEHGHDHEHAHKHTHEHTHTEHGHSHHHHAGMEEITALIQGFSIPDQVRQDVLAVYTLIAEAESHAHGRPVEEIHFHEVGAMDAVADVTGVCMLLYELAPDRIAASPVHVGCGQVRCAHGILPVPAPATAYILRDVPIYGGGIQGELCTPTGAALLKHFATEFGPMPVMQVERIGYGMGHKDFEAANCVRALLGEAETGREAVVELCCNLDDMTPEALGFAIDRLWAGGALDVYTTPVQMKKSRPGVLLTCMCRSAQRDEMIRLIFLHTTTLGLRESVCSRYTLERSVRTAETPYGPIRIKHAAGYGVSREKAEYEDLARIARSQNIPLSDITYN